jgi:broad specificity phosphatase PhoE
MASTSSIANLPHSNGEAWPARLWLVRHGESAGNVARNDAYAAGRVHIDIEGRDVDVALSPRGVQQAQALGNWFARAPESSRPEVILTSPYARACETARLIAEGCAMAGARCRIVVDERLREKEFGILNRLTRQGIEQLYPQEAEFRSTLGKFYYRPPGGESWCDVILRLRSVLQSMGLYYAQRRVLVVGHQVVVLCFRYLIEDMTESDVLAIDAEGEVINCSLTEYEHEARARHERQPHASPLTLVRYNWVVPLEVAGAVITAQPDASRAAR